MLAFPLIVLLLMLAACGGTSPAPSGGGNTGSAGARGPITVGGKLDTEAQLLTKMYSLLLSKAGFQVTEKAALGNSNIVFQAITSKQIDLYPEFTATGLNKLQIPSSYDPKKDYQTVKDEFDKRYQITWLDPSPLNDGYALCTSKDESQKLGVTSLSQLAPKVGDLILVSPSDGVTFVDGLKKTYNIDTKSFKQVQTVNYGLSFTAISSGKAQIMVCYGTDIQVPAKNFIFLQDDKNGFPAFNPAPIVRNDTLAKYPDIKNVLNPLAPKLTTEVSLALQKQVQDKKQSGISDKQAIKEVATDFLKSQGLY
ncbi:MAG: glycine/betaine ABC transporter substrate-binding protein [Ktedonobacteraceae bacterium]|nr:glycine/betaine ABC transporter substrate-binding protein [Ktedonobacteraceae bacterium]